LDRRPVGRIQGWLYQGSTSSGYISLQRAEGLKLFDLTWEGVQGINERVAWIYSGGIVSEDG